MTDMQNIKSLAESMPQMPKPWKPTDAEVENIARVCHEANRALCLTQGDLSQPEWDAAPDWQKQSAVEGVKFHLANPHADGRQSHDKLLESKLRAGWRFGEVKDAEAKTHPCCLPYDCLPPGQRLKDDLFIAVVRGWANAQRRMQQQ
jgi:hypothetical protein